MFYFTAATSLLFFDPLIGAKNKFKNYKKGVDLCEKK